MVTPSPVRNDAHVTQKSHAKGFRGSTHRAIAPEHTLERITPWFAAAGITRLADITGLDRIGIPVTLAIRPNARTVVGSTGKGSTLVAAQVSGAMEAIEMYHAEYAPMEVVEASLEQLRSGQTPTIDVDRVPLVRHQHIQADKPYKWTPALEVLSGEDKLVPFSSVHLRPIIGTVSTSASPFQRSSNGLASGNLWIEAVLSGLYEVIERDAYAVARARPGFWGRDDNLVNTRALGLPEVSALIERCDDAGILVMVHDMTSDVGIPAFTARMFDLANPGSGTAVGYGCHLETEVALVRAITEAAQSRAVVQVAGSRDDTTKYERWTMKLFAEEVASAQRRQARAQHVPRSHNAGSTFDGDLGTVLDRLTAIGISEVAVVHLTEPGWPISVVRVVVPGLEGIHTFPSYTPGPRAHAAARMAAKPMTSASANPTPSVEFPVGGGRQ